MASSPTRPGTTSFFLFLPLYPTFDLLESRQARHMRCFNRSASSECSFHAGTYLSLDKSFAMTPAGAFFVKGPENRKPTRQLVDTQSAHFAIHQLLGASGRMPYHPHRIPPSPFAAVKLLWQITMTHHLPCTRASVYMHACSKTRRIAGRTNLSSGPHHRPEIRQTEAAGSVRIMSSISRLCWIASVPSQMGIFCWSPSSRTSPHLRRRRITMADFFEEILRT